MMKAAIASRRLFFHAQLHLIKSKNVKLRPKIRMLVRVYKHSRKSDMGQTVGLGRR